MEDKMFDMLYNSLLDFAKNVEGGLALAVGDVNLGIEKVRLNIEPKSQEIKYGKLDVKYKN